MRKIPEVRTRQHILFPVLNVPTESLQPAVRIVPRASVLANNGRLSEAGKYVWSCSTIVTVGRGDSVGVATGYRSTIVTVSRGDSVGVATRCRLDSPGIESQRGRDFPHPSRPTLRTS